MFRVSLRRILKQLGVPVRWRLWLLPVRADDIACLSISALHICAESIMANQ